jgi:hypothetical protein
MIMSGVVEITTTLSPTGGGDDGIIDDLDEQSFRCVHWQVEESFGVAWFRSHASSG